MKNTAVESMTASSERGERGFSTIELLVVVSIILIVCAISITQLAPNMQQARVDAEMREVLGTFRQAREYAITNRRYIKLSFPTTSTIQAQQMNTLTPGAGAANPIIKTLSLTLSPPMVFNLAGMPITPDAAPPNGCATLAPCVFQCIANGPVGGMLFQSDGELLDGATYLPINGTVFMGYPGLPSTARAVTILGTTGRVRGWKSNGALAWYQF